MLWWTRGLVSIPRNPIILTQLAAVVGAPFGLVVLALLIRLGILVRPFIGIDMLVGLLPIAAVKGRYAAVLSSIGHPQPDAAKQARSNRIMNGLLVLYGLVAGQPTFAGVGLLAQSRQSVFIKWSKMKTIKMYPRWRTIFKLKPSSDQRREQSENLRSIMLQARHLEGDFDPLRNINV